MRQIARWERCIGCHVEPLRTEPGWNLDSPPEIGIDSYGADRAPDGVYKTMHLSRLFVREEGLLMDQANKARFYHDGRFATLKDIVKHYNQHFGLGLTDQEMNNLVK